MPKSLTTLKVVTSDFFQIKKSGEVVNTYQRKQSKISLFHTHTHTFTHTHTCAHTHTHTHVHTHTHTQPIPWQNPFEYTALLFLQML